MKNKIITKELAKLYEKQGYLEDSLECYSLLYDKTQKKEFAQAIDRIQNKIDPIEKSSIKKKSAAHWEKFSDFKSDFQALSALDYDSKNQEDNKALTLFEQWVNMIVLEKRIHNFKKIQARQK